MPILTCKQCGIDFKCRKLRSGNGTRKFCSMNCSSTYQRGKTLPKRAKSVVLKCKNCFNDFTERHCVYLKRSRLFCSLKCYQEHRERSNKVIICCHCGLPKKVISSYLMRGQYKYCSYKCAHDSKFGEKILTTLKSCVTCGLKFKGRESVIHCSVECRKRRSHKECEKCNKVFEYKLADQDRRFCSNACYKSSNSETSIEKIVRQFLESRGVVFRTQVSFKRYVIDFLLPEIGLIIEADGSYWHSKKSVKERDSRRDEELRMEGFKVVRLTETEIKNGNFINHLTSCLN